MTPETTVLLEPTVAPGTVSALDVADEILFLTKGATRTRIRHLVYRAHGICLANFNKPLVHETWTVGIYGPQLFDMHQALCPTHLLAVEEVKGGDRERLDASAKALIFATVAGFKGWDDTQLIIASMNKGSAWDLVQRVVDGHSLRGDREIPNDLIQKEFVEYSRLPFKPSTTNLDTSKLVEGHTLTEEEAAALREALDLVGFYHDLLDNGSGPPDHVELWNKANEIIAAWKEL